eukprot:c8564_g1_i1.p1 GENE.c8564_g1_i1~~c8564_g1_i1.p1  ORF type:complete len:203 (+),score=78.21 c8564_g1_i1:39-647(+)
MINSEKKKKTTKDPAEKQKKKVIVSDDGTGDGDEEIEQVIEQSPEQRIDTEWTMQDFIQGMQEGEQPSVDIDEIKKVRDWVTNQIEQEKKKIEQNGSKCIPMKTSRMGIVYDGNKWINRLDIMSGQDFEKVTQIMISDVVECPNDVREGFSYLNVLLFTDKPIPMICPYIFKKDKGNKLKWWLFVNSDGKRALHRVEGFNPL